MELKIKNYWRDFNETWWECSVPNPDQVLLFFKFVRNPIWLPRQPSWKKIHFYKWNLNSKTTEGISMKLGGSVHYPTLTKCCYFSSSFEIQYGCQYSHFEKGFKVALFLMFKVAITWKWCKLGACLLLIINRNSYMGFILVTLNLTLTLIFKVIWPFVIF